MLSSITFRTKISVKLSSSLHFHSSSSYVSRRHFHLQPSTKFITSLSLSGPHNRQTNLFSSTWASTSHRYFSNDKIKQSKEVVEKMKKLFDEKTNVKVEKEYSKDEIEQLEYKVLQELNLNDNESLDDFGPPPEEKTQIEDQEALLDHDEFTIPKEEEEIEVVKDLSEDYPNLSVEDLDEAIANPEGPTYYTAEQEREIMKEPPEETPDQDSFGDSNINPDEDVSGISPFGIKAGELLVKEFKQYFRLAKDESKEYRDLTKEERDRIHDVDNEYWDVFPEPITADEDGDMDLELESEFPYERIISIGRHSNMTKQGRAPSFSAFVIVGNLNGSAGIGYGKGLDPNSAIKNARRTAISTMVSIKRYEDRTILSPIYFKFMSFKVRILPRKKGRGLRAVSLGYEVARAFGIKDVSVHINGPRHNNRNKLICLFKAFTEIHITPEEMTKARGKKFVDRNLLWEPPKERDAREERRAKAYEFLKNNP